MGAFLGFGGGFRVLYARKPSLQRRRTLHARGETERGSAIGQNCSKNHTKRRNSELTFRNFQKMLKYLEIGELRSVSLSEALTSAISWTDNRHGTGSYATPFGRVHANEPAVPASFPYTTARYA